jgi:hypothetical protein
MVHNVSFYQIFTSCFLQLQCTYVIQANLEPRCYNIRHDNISVDIIKKGRLVFIQNVMRIIKSNFNETGLSYLVNCKSI